MENIGTEKLVSKLSLPRECEYSQSKVRILSGTCWNTVLQGTPRIHLQEDFEWADRDKMHSAAALALGELETASWENMEELHFYPDGSTGGENNQQASWAVLVIGKRNSKMKSSFADGWQASSRTGASRSSPT